MESKGTLRVVLDTNVILSSVSSKSPYKIILDKLFENKYQVYLTTDILLEYEEKISSIFDIEVAELVIGAILLLPNVHKIETYFHFHLISQDKDDNKFSDCVIASNAHYLVTNDKHFNELKDIPFPKINILKIEEFRALLKHL